jgi:mRNA-degrading endonuclease RelE of RelBE toxin-antitoxin system
VGNYRVVYEIDDGQQQVTIFHVGHRRDVYL